MSLSIIIPAYNEREQVNLTAKKLNSLTQRITNMEIIFIDDLSTDDTYIKLKKLKYKYKKIKVFKNFHYNIFNLLKLI